MEKQIIKRKNLRISGYNYSSEGLYFITICIKEGTITNILLETKKNI